MYLKSYPCFLLECVLMASILVTLNLNIQWFNTSQYCDISQTLNFIPHYPLAIIPQHKLDWRIYVPSHTVWLSNFQIFRPKTPTSGTFRWRLIPECSNHAVLYQVRPYRAEAHWENHGFVHGLSLNSTASSSTPYVDLKAKLVPSYTLS